MDSKLIIFLVFASLAQCSFVHSLTADFGLSDDDLASLNTLKEYEVVAAQAAMDGFDPIFVKMETEASKLIYGLESGCIVNNSESSEISESLKNAIDYSLDGFLVIVGEPCSVMEEHRAKTYSNFANISTLIASAFKLAVSGDFSINRDQLEAYETTILEKISDSVQSAYAALSTCLASEDTGIQAEIEYATEQSDLGLRYATYGVFNAMKLLSVAITAGEADISLLTGIEEFRGLTLNVLRYDLQNKFSALQAILLARALNLTGSMNAVSKNQYTWTISSFHYDAAIENFFNTILEDFEAVEYELTRGGRANLSRTEANEVTQIARTIAAYELNLDAALAIHPDATAAVEAAKEQLGTAVRDTIGSFYDAVETCQAAKGNYAESVEKVETLRVVGAANVDAYVATHFNLLINGQTYSNASATELTTLKDEANEHFLTAMNSMYDAAIILCRVHDEANASEEDHTAILTAKNLATSSADLFTEKVAAAGMIVIEAENDS